jgi:hypothetical protein
MHISVLLAAWLWAAPEPARPEEPAAAPPAGERPSVPQVEQAERPHVEQAEQRRVEARELEPKAAPPKKEEAAAPVASPAMPKPPKPPEVPSPVQPARPVEAAPEAKSAEVKAAPERRSSAEEGIASVARAYYVALLSKDVDRLVSLSRAPFYFESRAVSSPEEIKKRWASALANQPLESLRLLDIEVLSHEEMIKKYGKPPERLAAWPAGGGTYTVGNLSGHAAVVLWRRNGNGWQALAFHD